MTSTVGLTGTDLLVSARERQPLLRDSAADHDTAGVLSAPVVDALHRHGLFGMDELCRQADEAASMVMTTVAAAVPG